MTFAFGRAPPAAVDMGFELELSTGLISGDSVKGTGMSGVDMDVDMDADMDAGMGVEFKEMEGIGGEGSGGCGGEGGAPVRKGQAV